MRVIMKLLSHSIRKMTSALKLDIIQYTFIQNHSQFMQLGLLNNQRTMLNLLNNKYSTILV